MSVIKRIAALVIAIAAILPASAQFAIGPRVGINVNSLHFNKDLFDSDNRVGYNAGVEMEFTVPVIGVGFDLSLMYVNRKGQYRENPDLTTSNIDNASCSYIEIPLNFKYKLGLPAIGSIITPYVFTGPSFAFRTSKEAVTEFYKSKKCDIAWNFGIGLQLIKHLQIGASYGLGMTKAVEYINPSHQSADIDGKNKYWTVTAAWLF